MFLLFAFAIAVCLTNPLAVLFEHPDCRVKYHGKLAVVFSLIHSFSMICAGLGNPTPRISRLRKKNKNYKYKVIKFITTDMDEAYPSLLFWLGLLAFQTT
jgi:hypothetical protein